MSDPPRESAPALTREQVRRIDRLAVERLGMPSIVLMENAAINAASFVIDLLRDDEQSLGPDPRVAVLCGGGNNGGDGYALARHLHNFGLGVECFALSDPAKLDGDAKVNHDIAEALGLPISPVLDDAALEQALPTWRLAAAVVDAMLGTGFTGEVRARLAGVIQALNDVEHPRVVSLDIPSGLDADTGEPGGVAVRAAATISFVADKAGFTHEAAQAYLGRLVTADIGIPHDWAMRIATQDA